MIRITLCCGGFSETRLSQILLRPEILRSLPASSEGLAIVEETAYVLIDGDRGDGAKPARFQVNMCSVTFPAKSNHGNNHSQVD